MNLGRGLSIPQENGVIQNGDIWVPTTLGNPILVRPNNGHPQMLNNPRQETWLDLLGIYGGVLNDSADVLSQKFVPNSQVATCNRMQQPSNSVRQKTVLLNSTQVIPSDSYGNIPQSYNRNLLNDEFGRFPRFGNLDPRIPTSVQTFSEVVPQGINSIAELMSRANSTYVPISNSTPSRSSYVMSRPAVACPNSLTESSQMSYRPVGVKVHRNQMYSSDYGVGGYNLQVMSNGRNLVPYGHNYNLNLSLRPQFVESSSSARPLLLGPQTPSQQMRSNNYEVSQVPISLTGETCSKEMHKKDVTALSLPTETLVREQGESLLVNLDTPTEAVLTSPAEKSNSDGGIDLNKTPQQKTPKRRKHRPKVVVEGKPKRTPKAAATPASDTPNGKPKRKYVRKNGNKTSTPPTEMKNVVEVSEAGPAKKSCKRTLNFEMDSGAEKESHSKDIDCQAQNNERSKLSFNLNLDSTNELPQLNRPLTSAMREGHLNSRTEELQQIKTVNNFVHSNKVVPQDSIPLENTAPVPAVLKDHTLNIIARSMNARNARINQANGPDSLNHVHQHISGSIGQLVTQANFIEPDLHSRRQALLKTLPQFRNIVNVNGEQGSKRGQMGAELRQLDTASYMNSQLYSYGVSKAGQYNNGSSNILQNSIGKGKMQIGDKFHGASSSLSSGLISIKDSSGQMEGIWNNNRPARSHAIHQNGGLTSFNGKGLSLSRNSNDKPESSDWCISYQEMMRDFQQQHGSSHSQQCIQQTIQKSSTHTSEQNCNPASASQKDSEFTTKKAVKRQSVGRPKKVQPVDNLHQQQSQKSSKKGRESQKEQKTSCSLDDITCRMKELHISETSLNDRNALVPYKGDGAIVEYDPVKKKRPRPRVDLDPETNRLWNLLMGKEGSESAETLDPDKQKWWDEERKVFRGRVDSFIARMHLVQGDRRFSKWKGSVVDSVIGVFLTQNVSDHLSSSAFMSIAAKFPIKSTTFGQAFCGNEASSSVAQVQITFPDGTTYHDKITKEVSYNYDLTTYLQSSECRGKNVLSENGTCLMNDQSKRSEDDIISSQSSSESFILQASEDIRSSSGSNSEAEDGLNFGRNLGYLSVPEQPEGIAALQQHQSQVMAGSFPAMSPMIGHQNLENSSYMQNIGTASSSNEDYYPFIPRAPSHGSSVRQSSNKYWTNMLMGEECLGDDFIPLSEKESSSAWASNFHVSNGKGIEPVQGQHAGLMAAQNGSSQFQLPPTNHASQNNFHEMPTDFSTDGSQSRNCQQFSNSKKGKQVEAQQDSTFRMKPVGPAQASNKEPSDNSKGTGITCVTTEKEQVQSYGKSSPAANSATSNARKRKAEKGKEVAFDWDILRKQLLSSAGIRERSRETMDSIDYEAVRNAEVHEISETIRARGMNNMLAERMKDFLNRLVQDHGSVDLEWLRDVPPDKAKEYLLSIRGLGLKSVECVRLLTLHHLAFPVDTNVGRIAVRLGWVPLQPLPESLQLHLLELYPVLESIQKYLWPRLCKLDQETLYELHYQMITFGKVFCTKKQPNCNACPMRAECRHFASAFASARLALPAPGENQVVVSEAASTSTKSSTVIQNPLPLLSIVGSVEGEIGLGRSSEPLIEEPTTPEISIEDLERDIEDAFYEDPDEIPEIKLSVEQFTSNLEHIIQEKLELGEADMSKALVALSPELASMQIPKLKNINRLRTEHQVYELPDSHPLLKGMDRREPDDPSPYLLAIWAPGETPDSIQPPERTCSSQEQGGMCSRKTCFPCCSAREAQTQTVRGTILIPCRTAMRGSFPLNGTYFQVNEVFADDESSTNPITVPRSWIWNLPRRTVFFGTSVTSIFRGLSTEGIQYCFWKGFVCVRGFEQKTRAPRPLKSRFHLPPSKVVKKDE
ncbi:transcriptional activator DEMETER-like [Andrographis paniculata]|uniref:transcriptional activator DEMETER-like n=1 Tax=Andrographis paniculata TaxID=175694 RepID=UPI0021E80468|nr:transcriptional activator DEMETER-like [Andrographis paniculata]